MAFVRPAAPTGGDNYSHRGCLDHLVGYYDPQLVEVETKHGVRDAARCARIVDFDTGHEWTDALVFGSVFVRQLTTGPAGARLGRVAQGEASGGKNAPWVLEDPTDADIARAEAYEQQASEAF